MTRLVPHRKSIPPRDPVAASGTSDARAPEADTPEAATSDVATPDGAALGTGTAAYPPMQTWPTGRLLSAAARRVERSWDAYLERWDVTHASVPVLVVLADGPLSQRELAMQMHVTEQSLGRVVRNLEQSGHVTRQRHADDRRRFVVAITPTGRKALAALDDTKAAEALIGTSLSAAGIAELRALLIRLISDHPHPAGDAPPKPAT